MSEKTHKKNNKKKTLGWPLKAFFLTFFLALVFSFFSETTLLGVPLFVAVIVLFFIIFVGIVFDIIGISVTFQNISTFTAMASKKIRGAKQALLLIQNADTVSNICNDVVGDICGIVSGAMGAAIAARLLIFTQSTDEILISILLSSLIAAATVGGKAVGKKIALQNSQKIVFFAGKFLAFFSPINKGSKK